MAIKTVALIGASGTLGPFILSALQSSSSFQTTVLIRESSRSTFSGSVSVKKYPDELEPREALVNALQGQDALVLSYSGGFTAQSKAWIDAAIEAGVKLVIPADFGSCDSSDTRSLGVVPLYKEKEKVRNYLIESEGKGKGRLSWTSLITGHFLDYGLNSPLLGLDIKAGTAKVFNEGDKMWSCTTREGIGMAVKRILELGEDEKGLQNKLIYIQQVRTSQNELIKAVESSTGKVLSVTHVDSDNCITELKAKLYRADGSQDGDIVEELVCVEGIVNGDWSEKPTLANEILGIKEEDVKSIVSRLLANR